MKIGILLGDDIGLEVVPEAVKVIKAAAAKTPELQAIFEKSGMTAPVDKAVDDARAGL